MSAAAATVALTIALLRERLEAHIGKTIVCPKTLNKGAAGLLLETVLGIPHSPRCLDCDDGELKVFPVKRNTKTGALVPKETIAVTMVDRTALATESFAESRVFRKMARMLCVPYERTGDTVIFYRPTLIELEDGTNAALRARLEEDYKAIQSHFVATGEMSSSLGGLLQTRTKGAGHGSTSRAFYLRTAFAAEYVPIHSA
jgi:DNA mismatch repair protein MutH